MKTYKNKLILLAIILLIIACGIVWLFTNYHFLGARLYPKNASELDLRGQTISIEQYEQLQQTMPNCRILWDVPLRSGLYANNSTELAIPVLSESDEALLQYFSELKTLYVDSYENPSLLLSLIRAYPELNLICSAPISGQRYPQNTTQLQLDGIAPEEIAFLPLLPDLALVTIDGSCDAEALRALRDYCFANRVELRIVADTYIFSSKDTDLTIDAVTDNLIVPLSMMIQLKTLHLPEPKASAKNLLQLRESLTDTAVTWEKTVLGKTFSSDAAEIDLTEILALNVGQVPGDRTPYKVGLEYPVQGTPEEVPSSVKISKFHPLPDKTDQTKELIEEVEAAMAYFPDAEKLVMGGCWLHNIHMSNFRERHREDYNVVWHVQCGELATRTDATFFMPVKYHVYYFFTEDAYNLKFCEDMVAIDVGHMLIEDVSFVKYMPNLTYLVIAFSNVYDISPLQHCKNLVFLELECTPVRDLTPLLQCTALEDLNVSMVYADPSPLYAMVWLKHVWYNFCASYAYNLKTMLPDLYVQTGGDATVSDGWRNLSNYFAMRDALLMYYMEW